MSALDIFMRLEMWEEAISCYQMLGKAKQAEDLVQEQLLKHANSPKFLCVLGDIQGKADLYWQAWESSNHRYSRAMRSLGAEYFKLGKVSISLLN